MMMRQACQVNLTPRTAPKCTSVGLRKSELACTTATFVLQGLRKADLFGCRLDSSCLAHRVMCALSELPRTRAVVVGVRFDSSRTLGSTNDGSEFELQTGRRQVATRLACNGQREKMQAPEQARCMSCVLRYVRCGRSWSRHSFSALGFV